MKDSPEQPPKMTAEEIAVYQKEKQGQMDQLIAEAVLLSPRIIEREQSFGENLAALHADKYIQLFWAFMTDLIGSEQLTLEVRAEIAFIPIIVPYTKSKMKQLGSPNAGPIQFDRIEFLNAINKLFGGPVSRAPGLTFIDSALPDASKSEDQQIANPLPKMTAEEIAVYQKEKQGQMDQLIADEQDQKAKPDSTAEQLDIDKPVRPAPVPPVSQDQDTSAAVSMRLWGGCMAVLGGLAVALALTVIFGVPGAIVGTIGIAVALIGVGLFSNSFMKEAEPATNVMVPAAP